MSAHLSRLRLFQRYLRSLVWVWVWVWDWIHWNTSPRTRSPSSLHPPFTHYSFSPRSPVYGGKTSPHKTRLVVSHNTCSPRASSPHAHSFVLGTAVINNNKQATTRDERTPIEATSLSATSAELVLGLGLDLGLGSHCSSHAPSHAPLLLATLLSHTFPFPRVN